MLTEIKKIITWQEIHDKQDEARFASIPKIADIINAMGNTVDIKINGKLIDLKRSSEKLTEHLEKQDVFLIEMNRKIKPLWMAKEWVKVFGKIIIYVGGICGAVGAIIFLYKQLT